MGASDKNPISQVLCWIRMALMSTFHGKIEVGEQAFPFLNRIVIFTTSEQISGISPTDSLRHRNQVPCVCMGWGRAGMP